MSENNWPSYEKLVLHELQETGRRVEAIAESINQLRVEIGALKVKAAVAGASAGIVATGVTSALVKFMFH